MNDLKGTIRKRHCWFPEEEKEENSHIAFNIPWLIWWKQTIFYKICGNYPLKKVFQHVDLNSRTTSSHFHPLGIFYTPLYLKHHIFICC